jgi:hypothetical protein
LKTLNLLKPIGAAALLALSSSVAWAADTEDFVLDSAGDLADLCSNPGEVAAIHMCQGYLAGVNHMHAAMAAAVGAGVYCIPQDGSVTRNSAARDFAAWVAATPEVASMPARDGLLEWARQTYPCK